MYRNLCTIEPGTGDASGGDRDHHRRRYVRRRDRSYTGFDTRNLISARDHRLLPGFASRYLAEKVMALAPFVFYCHPYEFDALEFAEIPIKVPLRVRLHQGIGRRWFMQRFKAFLYQFGGQRMEDLLSSTTWQNYDLASFARSTVTSAGLSS